MWCGRASGSHRRMTMLVHLATATVVGTLMATPLSAFDAQPDTLVVGAITIIADDWVLALLASDMWGTQKRLRREGLQSR